MKIKYLKGERSLRSDILFSRNTFKRLKFLCEDFSLLFFLNPKNRWNFQFGFTLLELLIVLAIIGMATALVIPRIGTSEMTFLKVQVREAVSVLRYARRAAIIEGQQKTVIFSEGHQAAHQATMIKTPTNWVSRGVTLQGDGQVFDGDKTVYKMTFYPEGGSTGGELSLSYFEHTAKITVNPITGKIKSEILF